MKALQQLFAVGLDPASAWRGLLVTASCGLICSSVAAGPLPRSFTAAPPYDGGRGSATCTIPTDDPKHAIPPSHGGRSIGDDPDPYTGSRVAPGHPRLAIGNGPPTDT
jgi:hypothetical protein